MKSLVLLLLLHFGCKQIAKNRTSVNDSYENGPSVFIIQTDSLSVLGDKTNEILNKFMKLENTQFYESCRFDEEFPLDKFVNNKGLSMLSVYGYNSIHIDKLNKNKCSFYAKNKYIPDFRIEVGRLSVRGPIRRTQNNKTIFKGVEGSLYSISVNVNEELEQRVIDLIQQRSTLFGLNKQNNNVCSDSESGCSENYNNTKLKK